LQRRWGKVALFNRTAKNIQISADGETWSSLEDEGVTRGHRACREGVLFTKKAYGPMMVVVWWGRDYAEPIYLISNLKSLYTHPL
jgi:hypothetical protein